MSDRDSQEKNSYIRSLTEEEIERSKIDHGEKPLSKAITKYMTEKLTPTYLQPFTNRVCDGCGKKIADSERAFPRYTQPKGDSHTIRRRVNHWYCLECYEEREEAIIKYNPSKSSIRRQLLRSKNS